MARRTKIAAIFGHPTYLYGHLRWRQSLAFDPGAPGRWKRYEVEALGWCPGRLRVKLDAGGEPVIERIAGGTSERSLSMVKGRWIYVFVYRGQAGSTRWVLEMYVDDAACIHVNPAANLADRLAWNVGDTPATHGPKPELPRTVTGRKWYVTLLGTPFRLTDDCIATLETDDKLLHLVTPTDLTEERYLEIITSTEHGHDVPSEPRLAVPVLLPLDVARQLAHDICAARSKRANLMGVEGELGPASDTQVETSQKYFVSRGLRDLADHPALKDDVEDDFAAGRLDEMKAFVDDFERRVAKLDLLAESIGAELALWFRRELIQILLDGAVEGDGPIVLDVVDEIFAGMTQSAAGLACLGRECEPDRATSFVHRHFSGTSALGSAEAKTAKSSLSRFVTAFAQVQKSRIAHMDISAHQMLVSLDTVLGPLAPGWPSGDIEAKLGVFREVALRETLTPDTPATRELVVKVRAMHADAGAMVRLGKALRKTELAFKLLDTLNFALALQTYRHTDPAKADLRKQRLFGAAATGGSVLAGILNKTFELVGRKSVWIGARIAVRGLGFISAVATLHMTHQSAKKEIAAGDYDAAIANYVSTGFALGTTGVSFACTVLDAAAFGWVGAALAVVSGAAYVFYLYVKDKEIETLVLWSAWGDANAQGDDAPLHPLWSPVRLGDLRQSWDHQSIALGALQRQFALGFGGRAGLGEKPSPFYRLRIFVGHVDADTAFDVTWSWKGKRAEVPGTETQTWVLSLEFSGSGSVTGAFGKALRVSAEGEPYFDVNIPEAAFRDSGFYELHGGYGFEDLRVTVRKRYAIGPFVRLVPPGSPVELVLQPGNEGPDTSLIARSLGDH